MQVWFTMILLETVNLIQNDIRRNEWNFITEIINTNNISILFHYNKRLLLPLITILPLTVTYTKVALQTTFLPTPYNCTTKWFFGSWDKSLS